MYKSNNNPAIILLKHRKVLAGVFRWFNVNHSLD